MTHSELKHAALQKPEVQAAYEALGPEFEILRQMLQAREDAGLTQAQVAERMGTKPPAVTRLESSLSSGKHSPSLATLRKYAEAVGCRLEVRLVRVRTRSNSYEVPGCQEPDSP
jgi:transcriptional regulator with XRE-family HTH domain